MQQKCECSRSAEPEGADEGLGRWGGGGGGGDDRERRISAYSVRTISTVHSSAEFVARGASPSIEDVRRSMVFGREMGDVRLRTVSAGEFRRVSADSDGRRSFSPLSREWRDSIVEGERDRSRDSLRSMQGQWLSVSDSREGSLRSVHTGESGQSKKAVQGGVLLDDGASGRSGTYYSARSSFSTSG